MKSVLNKAVSLFKSYNDPNPVDINLMTFINSRKHKDVINLIRMMDKKEERDIEKSKLPCITPSGTFTYRHEKGLINHSGLIQFDIDYKGNEHIDNFEDIVHEIGRLSFIAYCGFSASGYGVWGLVPIAYPEKHKLHLQALKTIFKSYDLKMDNAPANVASLRGYSYDDNAHINPNAEIFTYIHKQEEIRVIRSNNYESTIEQKFDRAIKKTQQHELFADGAKHCFLVKLAGYCNSVGIDYDTVVNLVEQNFRGLTSSDVDLEKPIANVYKGYKSQFAEYA
jgi:hypothetical protein